MVALGTAPGVPGWPDLKGRHELTHRVNDFPGNALGFCRAGPGLFEAGVELLSSPLAFYERVGARLRRWAADFASPLP
jgi:hypothetical protein